MNKTKIFAAIAVFFLGMNSVAYGASVLVSDTCVVEQKDTCRKNATRSAFGNLLGSMLSNAAGSNKDVTVEDSIAPEVKKVPVEQKSTVNSQEAIGNILGSVLAGAANSKTTQQSGNNNAKDIIGGILGAVADKATGLTAAKLSGTWNYTGSKCVFESQNVVRKAGSEILAATLENKLNNLLQRIGMKSGNYSFTFSEDGSFTSVLGSRTYNGTYTLDTEKKLIRMSYLAGTLNSEMEVTVINNQLSLLHNSDNLLKMLTALSAKSTSQTMRAVNAVIGSYDGLKIGLEFAR